MAITPDFNPTRILQPISSPVDSFVNPVLPRPADALGGEQITRALSSLSNSLSGLGEDLLLARKQEDIAIGEAEGLAGLTPTQYREYEEKTGGMLPWRYQAALEAYGIRSEESYRTALFERLPELATPVNADGTPRTVEQVRQAMDQVWQSSMSGVTGHYASLGASRARARTDAEFINSWGQQRRANIIKDNEAALRNIVFKTMSTGSQDLSESIGNIKEVQAAYHAIGLGAGRETIMDATVDYFNLELANADSSTDFDGLRAAARNLAEKGIGGPLDEDMKARLTAISRKVDAAEIEVSNRQLTVDNARLAALSNKTFGEVATLMAQRKTEVTHLNMSDPQVMGMIDSVLDKSGASVDDRAQLRGLLFQRSRELLNNLNSPPTPDPTVFQKYFKTVEQDPEAAQMVLNNALTGGSINFQQWKQLTEVREHEMRSRELYPKALIDSASISIKDIAPNPDNFTKDYQGELENQATLLNSQLATEAREALREVAADSSLTDSQKRNKGAQIVSDIKKRLLSSWYQENKDRVAEANIQTLITDELPDVLTGIGIPIRSQQSTVGGISIDIDGGDELNNLRKRAIAEQLMSDDVMSYQGNNDDIRRMLRSPKYLLDLRSRTEAAYQAQMEAERAPEPSPASPVDLMKEREPIDFGDPDMTRILGRYFQAVAEYQATGETSVGRRIAEASQELIDSASSQADMLRRTAALLPHGVVLRPSAPNARAGARAAAAAVAGGVQPQAAYLGAVDDAATKAYFNAMALSGQITSDDLLSDKTKDGVSISLAVTRGWLNPSKVPLFKSKKDLLAAWKAGAMRSLLPPDPTEAQLSDLYVSQLSLINQYYPVNLVKEAQ